jgi:serine protease Do
VRRVVEGALGGGVKLPWFGADGQPVTGQIAQAMNLPRPGGVLVKSVYADGPAAQAGLKSGDVVLQIDGVDVDDMQAINYRVATHRPGDVVRVHVASGGRKTREISFALSLPPENPPRQLTTIGGRNPLTGARVENLSPAVASDLDLEFSARGVVVVSTSENTPSGSYGFQAGDIIRSINGQEIHSVANLQRALEGAGGRWDMVIQRGNQRLTLSVSG